MSGRKKVREGSTQRGDMKYPEQPMPAQVHASCL